MPSWISYSFDFRILSEVLLLFQWIQQDIIFCSNSAISMNPIFPHIWQYNSYFNESHMFTYLAVQFLFQWIPYFHIYYNSYFNESHISTYITIPISIRPICILHRTIALSTDLNFSYFRHYFLSYFDEIHISQIWQCMPK